MRKETMGAYRWWGPGEWLADEIDRLAQQDPESAVTDLRALCVTLAGHLDSDTIQGEFQTDMEREGYFEQDS